ncbi:hypothetical protein QAD02_020025 [Eretmocerus hayati]|uniref:Uncharacterized protein n=1 Tax=Eretmocerus hayati TaxID=131215 RepID=A0ACC2PLB8_9HYME|nr:hypothetical protein QAD02_020025 [Eretmocerus hayati]
MASREKRPLAPSKSKQKANNDSGSLGASPTVSESSKGSASSKKSSRVSQLSLKSQLVREILEAETSSQPQAKLDANLPRKRALQTALKRKQKAKKTLIKVKQKVPLRTLKRIAESKKILKKKKPASKAAQQHNATPDSSLENSEESGGTKNKCKTAKRPKVPVKVSEEEETLDKNSPKSSKKASETSPKSAKSSKNTSVLQKKLDNKEKETKGKRSLSKEPEEVKIKTEPIDNSYEVTIEEVIASSMLIIPKVEVDCEESASEGELKPRRFVKNPAAKRSLRNGKLRQAAVKVETDSEEKQSEESMAETAADSIMDVSVKTEIAMETTENSSTEEETNNNGCDSNGERIDEVGPTLRSRAKVRNSDSCSTDGDVKPEVKLEDTIKPAPKTEPDPSKKERALAKFNELKGPCTTLMSNSIAAKGRRSSLNLEMRRSSLYSPPTNDKSLETGSRSHIDDMIDEIKLSIAKTIESKMYRPDTKGIIFNKTFQDVPKVEPTVASLKKDLTEPKSDDDVGEEKPKCTGLSAGLEPSLNNKDVKNEDTENSVPKVADTAKEIEKLVMGDNDSSVDLQIREKKEPLDNAVADMKPVIVMDEKLAQDEESGSENAILEEPTIAEKGTHPKQLDESKKVIVACPTRKSARVSAGRYMSALETKKLTNISDLCSEKIDGEEESSDRSSDLLKDRKCLLNETTPKSKEEQKPETKKKDELAIEEAEEDVTEKTRPATGDSFNETEEKVSPKKASPNETLETLSREVEELIEGDEKNQTLEKGMEVAENETSDVEMRLIIDDEISEPTTNDAGPELVANTCSGDLGGDCDVKSDNETSSGLPVADTSAKSACKVQDDDHIVTTVISDLEDRVTGPDIKSTVKSDESGDTEEQKETRRVLRTRSDKKKVESIKNSVSPQAAQAKPENVTKPIDAAPLELSASQDSSEMEKSSPQTTNDDTSEPTDPPVVVKIEPEECPEPQIRTRRSREAKKPLSATITSKTKRGTKKQETKRSDLQNKEETLLDNEVAKINENDISLDRLKTGELSRGLSANGGKVEQQKTETKNRSKSENDVRSAGSSDAVVQPSNEIESLTLGTEKELVMDTNEASTSRNSYGSTEKLLETPEELAKKEDILRQLGLESWEKVKERKAKKEEQYTGTLKTVIRLKDKDKERIKEKDKDKDKDGKKRSRSPLKMVLNKQQGRNDGEESFDFYTIQKESGTSGSGDSSSGANRKLSTNPRHSCDEDNEEAPIKDRQSLVIPEKSSSFSIHPGRFCSDNCCYCHGKFGSLDTPMHLAQMKSDERKKKILETEVHLTKDSCLCDACYRHVDRKANMSPTNVQLKPQRQNRQPIMSCNVKDCSEAARHHVKRRWLLKIRGNLRNQVDINWDSTQHNLMTFCGAHFTKVEGYLTCTLCRRRLTKNFTYPLNLTASAAGELNKRLHLQGIPANVIANGFVCRLCRFFTKLHLKHVDLDNLTESNKEFHKKYRKKLLFYHDIEVPDSEEESESTSQQKNKEQKNRIPGVTNTSSAVSKKSKCTLSGSALPELSKPFDNFGSRSSTASDKSSPDPSNLEPETILKEDSIASTSTDSRFLGIEGAIEKLKKRKALDTTVTNTRSLPNSSIDVNSVTIKNNVELLPIDKEVTLTRLPKKPRLGNNTGVGSNDITPVVQRLGANPSISVRTLFPGEEEMNLHANVEFGNVREVTPQGWEKCATMIQYDRDTKILWQELQRPYGNQSSFLRHLILLEKYYRAGDLILAPNASRNAINYSTSVQNRLISYEGPEKMEEIPLEPANTIEYNNSRRLSGGYIIEREQRFPPSSSSSTSTPSYLSVASQLSKLDSNPPRVMKLTPGVSIIKKPPPNLQRLNLGSGAPNGSAKRKESIPIQKVSGGGYGGKAGGTGGKVFQLTEPELKRLQNLKRQKQINERQATSSPNNSSGGSSAAFGGYKMGPGMTVAQIHKAQQFMAQSQFHKHLLMQQEMLNQRSRSEFEPLICDVRSLSNENTPTQNLINTLNLPKSIQVTTKGPVASSTPIPILPKIPKSLTVIPQTVTRTQNK